MSASNSIISTCGDPPYPAIANIGNMIGGYGSPPYQPFPDGPTAMEYEALLQRVIEIEKRLAILQPNETLQEKFPALQEAYEAYKIVEKIVNENRG